MPKKTLPLQIKEIITACFGQVNKIFFSLELDKKDLVFRLFLLSYHLLHLQHSKTKPRKPTTGSLDKTLGWAYFWLIGLITIISVPLIILTNQGNG